MCLVTDGFHPAPQSSYLIMQVEDSICDSEGGISFCGCGVGSDPILLL